MRVEDVEGPVVSAATRTPFEAKRRVFVLERVDTMNDEVANRLLKTLEEPAHFVHLILLTESLGRVLDTVVSRCQLVRFEPLPGGPHRRGAGGRGSAARARAGLRRPVARQRHAGPLPRLRGGQELRAEVGRFVAAALRGGSRRSRGARCSSAPSAPAPWPRTGPRRSASSGSSWSRRGASGARSSASMEEAAKRDGRRARTGVLDLALTLTELAFRDLVCVAEGAPEAVLAVDSPPDLAGDARSRDARRLREAAERCEQTRQSLELNVTEELALSALGFRLAALAG